MGVVCAGGSGAGGLVAVADVEMDGASVGVAIGGKTVFAGLCVAGLSAWVVGDVAGGVWDAEQAAASTMTIPKSIHSLLRNSLSSPGLAC